MLERSFSRAFSGEIVSVTARSSDTLLCIWLRLHRIEFWMAVIHDIISSFDSAWNCGRTRADAPP